MAEEAEWEEWAVGWGFKRTEKYGEKSGYNIRSFWSVSRKKTAVDFLSTA